MIRGALGFMVLLLAAAPAVAAPRLLALCYHDVVETAAAARADATAVTVDTLVRQLAWLDAEGYQPISLATWAAAREGGPLPDKPVLLSFDDGFASFHRHVLPLLELFRFPAVLAPVTSWIDAQPGSQVPYGDQHVDRATFMTWAQIRQALDSGLVEVATHSDDLHHGVVGNPFGNTQPAAVTRQYHQDSGGYEPEHHYQQRLRSDLARSVALIEAHLGVRPKAVVWPYGAYNATATATARELGLAHSLTLDETPNTSLQHNVHRVLVGADMNLEAFVTTARGLRAPVRLRAAHVDLDYLFDADPGQQERNLDRLLDRIKAMGINRVFLQAFADPDGDGVADAVYFPNRHLPVRADLFNRVAWQLRTRSGVQVFAWMPVLAFELPDPADNRRLAVLAADGSQGEHYHRLSPFHPEARRTISDIYADLGRSSHFAGILFHDDGFLTDSEDASPAALAFYARYWPEQTGAATAALADGRPPAADAGADAFARAKTRHLIAFTEELADVLRREQPALVTARNLYARAVIQPASERWFAQNLRMFLDHYDYTAVMAMPYLEQAANPERWLARLVERVARWPNALERTLFEVQTRDWRDGKPLDAATLTRHLNLLLDAGVRHIAWYPDDFVTGHPDLEVIRATVSLSDHPAVPE